MKRGSSLINILSEGYRIDAPFLYEECRKHILPRHRVAVVAFSFRDSAVKSAEDWKAQYGSPGGKIYKGIVQGLAAYGIPKENVTFLNYFTDTKQTAARKIENADILYFPGGLPDKMMERILEFDLRDVLLRHEGTVIGYSAGALIQLAEYHLSPDADYPSFRYAEGLPYLRDFYLEVHYRDTPEQRNSIQRVIRERGKTVYATALMQGAILVENGSVRLLGNVKEYN